MDRSIVEYMYKVLLYITNRYPSSRRALFGTELHFTLQNQELVNFLMKVSHATETNILFDMANGMSLHPMDELF